MAAADGNQMRQYPGSPNLRPASPRSCRLIQGIRSDDEVLESNNCHMHPLDDGLRSIDLFAKGTTCYEKYQKLLSREKLMFQALFRRALRNSQTDPGAADHLPEQEFVKPPLKAYSTLPEISEQTGRELYKSRLSKLVVVKFVNFSKPSFKNEFLGVIHQLKFLNDRYSTEIPLLLVSNYYNDDFVQMVAKDYDDKKLSIHIIKQPLFPLVDKITLDPTEPKHYCFYVARREINEEHMHMPPHMVPRPDWYNPGEVFTLFEQVKRHFSVNEKEYILLLNSGMENAVDLKIFNYLCEPRDGPKIDICFEVIKPRVSDLSNASEFLVKSGERLRVVSQNSLHEAGYNIDTDGLILTKNLWISIPFLRNEESGTTLLEIAIAKELAVRDGEKSEIRLEMTLENLIEAKDAGCDVIEVPAQRLSPDGPLRSLWEKMNPTWAQKIKLKTMLTYAVWSFCYHLIIYLMTASLHEKYLKNDEAEECVDRLARQKREERELNIFWIDNTVWLLLVILYFLVLTSKRLKNSNKSRSPHQRQTRAWADFAQALLLGTTRFLYAGLNKTAEVKKWFGGNAWLYLLPLHFLSIILEVVGSLLIMYFIEAPELFEPLETS